MARDVKVTQLVILMHKEGEEKPHVWKEYSNSSEQTRRRAKKKVAELNGKYIENFTLVTMAKVEDQIGGKSE